MSILLVLPLVMALVVVLFGALGRDERDNMAGGCKAAAMRSILVPEAGLEPARPKPAAPKAAASTNSTTRASPKDT